MPADDDVLAVVGGLVRRVEKIQQDSGAASGRSRSAPGTGRERPSGRQPSTSTACSLPFRRKAGTVRKRARDASVQDVRKARRALRADGATGKAASKQEKAIRAAIAKSEGLRAVTIVIRGGQVSFGGVPLDQKALRELGRALSTVKLA